MNTHGWIIATLHEVGEKEHCTVLQDENHQGVVLTFIHKDVYEATLQIAFTVDLGVFMLSAARPRRGQKIDTVTGRWDDSLASMQGTLGNVHELFGKFIEQVHGLLQSGDVPFDIPQPCSLGCGMTGVQHRDADECVRALQQERVQAARRS